MKIVKPSVKTINDFYNEKIDSTIFYPQEARKIELAGRTCYDSFSKMNELDSDTNFCKNIIKSKHFSVLEFAHAILSVDSEVYDELRYANFKFLNMTECNDNYLISGNIRAWRGFVKTADCSSVLKEYILFKFINNEDYNPLFADIPWNDEINISDVSYNIKFETDYDLCEDERLMHVYYHFVVETDRAVLAELTRHRTMSFAVQSQRYVNYKKGVEFVKPHWYHDRPKGIINYWKRCLAYLSFHSGLRQSEKSYKRMIKMGMKPQDARSVLPNATKTIINISGSLEDFKWIFHLRCAKAAHPDIRNIADKMKRIVDFEENFK